VTHLSFFGAEKGQKNRIEPGKNSRKQSHRSPQLLNQTEISSETKVKEDYYIVVSEVERSLLSEQERQNEEEKIEESETESHKKVIKIMLVEDEKILRKATKKLIEKTFETVELRI